MKEQIIIKNSPSEQRKKQKKNKGSVSCETMQSHLGDKWLLRKPSDVGPVSLSNLRTNEIPRSGGGVAYVKEQLQNNHLPPKLPQVQEHTLVHFLTINSAVIKYYI